MRLVRPLLGVALATIGVASTASAGDAFPESIPLPVDFAPEGIAVGTGSSFFVGSLADGDIYRGDLRSGTGSVLVDAPPGRFAVGLKVDERHHVLIVAGGPTGEGYAYDADDGTPIDVVQLAVPGTSLINDVVVTADGAYFTDSLSPAIYKVPIAPDGTLGNPETITVTGPAGALVGFPNLNGIEATADGDTLIVAHSQLGLFTVDPSTGVSEAIALAGGELTPGTPDGLVLRGRSLWVVENFSNRLVEVRLSPDRSSGVVTDVVTNDDLDGLLRVPTTAALHGSRLAVVNARFDLGLPPPFGPGAPPGTDYDVVLVDAH
jgi:hypothetical protein